MGLSGTSKPKLKVIDLTSSSTVAHGATGNYLVQPDEGHIWKFKQIMMFIPDPVGSTAGTHSITLAPNLVADKTSNGQNYFFYISSDTGTAIIMGCNEKTMGTSARPSATTDQHLQILSLIVNHEHPLVFKYRNNTDTDQTSDIEIILWVEETIEMV